jgi:hypothetical protein
MLLFARSSDYLLLANGVVGILRGLVLHSCAESRNSGNERPEIMSKNQSLKVSVTDL